MSEPVEPYVQTWTAYDLPYELLIDQPEPEYGPYDREYDWGYAEDGWPVPSPCPVCGVLYGACTSDNYDPSILE